MKATSVIFLFIYALFVALGHILQKTVLNLQVDPMVFSFLRIGCGFIIISSIIDRVSCTFIQVPQSDQTDS